MRIRLSGDANDLRGRAAPAAPWLVFRRLATASRSSWHAVVVEAAAKSGHTGPCKMKAEAMNHISTGLWSTKG